MRHPTYHDRPAALIDRAIDSIEERELATLSAQWKAWVSHNVTHGCSPNEILAILVKSGVDQEVALAEIAAAGESSDSASTSLENASEGLDHEADFRVEKLAPYIWRLDDVLNEDECAFIINAARPRLRPCSVVVDQNQYGEAGSGRSDVRTGRAASFSKDELLPPGFDAVSRKIRELVAMLSNLPEENQEPIEILHYTPGEFFAEHFDAFSPGSEYLKWEEERGGQRLFTFSLYLNSVPAGGEVEFPNIGSKLTPNTGLAAFWHNMLDGALYHNSQHKAHAVEAGEKWVLTIWVRESAYGQPTPERQAIHDYNSGKGLAWISSKLSIEEPDWLEEATRTQQEKVPYLNAGGPLCRGFEKRVLAPNIFCEIQDQYESIKSQLAVETDACVGTVLKTVSPDFPTSLFAEDHVFNERLLGLLRPLHEEWCGFELEPVCVYGFRVYLPGAFLYNHVDIPQTHVVSSSVCVAQHLFEPWYFHAVDEDGRASREKIEPGEFVLYESARIAHGRPIPMNGQYYVSLYVHYKPACDSELWDASPADWWALHRLR